MNENDLRNLCISCGGRNASQFDDKPTITWTENIETYALKEEPSARPDEVVLSSKTGKATVIRTNDHNIQDALMIGAIASNAYHAVQLNHGGQFRMKCTLLYSGVWQTHNVNGVVSLDTSEELIASLKRYYD